MFWFQGQGLKVFSGDSGIKKPPAMQGILFQSLSWKYPLENKMATHSSFCQEIPWKEEHEGLKFMGSQKSQTKLSD